jgi:hypothetical protein
MYFGRKHNIHRLIAHELTLIRGILWFNYSVIQLHHNFLIINILHNYTINCSLSIYYKCLTIWQLGKNDFEPLVAVGFPFLAAT